MREQTTM
jgi:hypothetical protein